MKTSKKTISVRALSIVMLIAACIVTVISLLKENEAAACMRSQTEIAAKQKEYTDLAGVLAEASDYLTEKVNYFAATQDKKYLYQYWEEVDQVKRREKTIEALRDKTLPEGAIELAEAAGEASDELSEKEAWVMRLIADSIHMRKDEMPPKVAAVTYDYGEGALSDWEKHQTALYYLFGREYKEQKKTIHENIRLLQNLVMEQKQEELTAAVSETQEAQRIVALLDKGLLLLLIGFVGTFSFLVLRPFRKYAQAIETLGVSKLTELQPVGSKEAVLFADTFNRIYSGFIKNEQALENERFRFRIAVESTPVIVFEYDFATDTYSAYGKLDLEDDNGIHPTERVIPQYLKEHLSEIVEPEYLELARSLFSARSFVSADMRVKISPDHAGYVWARVTITPILDDHGDPVKLIGKIRNIELEKEQELALEDLKRRDSLTGLYTREAGIHLAREYMEKKTSGEICGIFILDMDDFEQINREEGSAFADAILQETASILKEMTGPDDYQIRLGGDEFMLFIKNCPKSRATVLGPRIAAEIQTLSGGSETGRRITASMGMCVTEVTDEYDSLYRCAESTLKFVKQNRRGTAACYLDTSRELGGNLVDLYPEQHEINRIDHAEKMQGAFISSTLELLENSKNLDDAIYLLLSRFGRSLGLRRVLIAEVNSDFLTCRYSYQWSADPSAGQMTNTYFLTRETLAALIHSYRNGLSEKPYAQHSEETGSVLHAAIWNHGEYEGFMSFEMGETGYQWTEEQRQFLKELSNIVSSFILREKSDAISQAKTEFLSRMSHEIRTPMNAISGMTEIAIQVLDDRDKVRNCLDKIKSSNTYLLSLINDILDMSRIESGKAELNPETADLERKLEELTVMFAPQFEQKGIQFTTQCEYDQDRLITADFLRLNQVLVNLLGNALKFTMPGGHVTLTAEQKDRTEQGITMKFSVRDTGIGIPEESMSRIFNAFEQADKNTSVSYGGTGLGLSISSRLIQMMGGRLEVNSRVGEGSDFFFTLFFTAVNAGETKTAAGNAARDEDDHDSMENYSGDGRRILLVEDNDLNREIAETILTMKGFAVDQARNGLEGVQIYASHPAFYYDAILMDIRMPVMDGLEAARQIRLSERDDSRTIPIIAMTANAFNEDMRKSIESGMDGHLSKPIDIDQLFEMLRNIIEKQGGEDQLTQRQRPCF